MAEIPRSVVEVPAKLTRTGKILCQMVPNNTAKSQQNLISRDRILSGMGGGGGSGDEEFSTMTLDSECASLPHLMTYEWADCFKA